MCGSKLIMSIAGSICIMQTKTHRRGVKDKELPATPREFRVRVHVSDCVFERVKHYGCFSGAKHCGCALLIPLPSFLALHEKKHTRADFQSLLNIQGLAVVPSCALSQQSIPIITARLSCHPYPCSVVSKFCNTNGLLIPGFIELNMKNKMIMELRKIM